jgi:hypothetical protein
MWSRPTRITRPSTRTSASHLGTSASVRGTSATGKGVIHAPSHVVLVWGRAICRDQSGSITLPLLRSAWASVRPAWMVARQLFRPIGSRTIWVHHRARRDFG